MLIINNCRQERGAIEVVDDQFICSWLASELSMMRESDRERQSSVISLPWLGKDRPGLLIIRHHGRLEWKEPAVVTSLYLKVIINPLLLRSAHPFMHAYTIRHATTISMALFSLVFFLQNEYCSTFVRI